jgi:hypothetical protein
VGGNAPHSVADHASPEPGAMALKYTWNQL